MAIDPTRIRWRIKRECELLDHDTPRDQIVRREMARSIRDCDDLGDVKALLEAYWLGEFDA